MDPASKTKASSMVASDREEHNGNNFEVFYNQMRSGSSALPLAEHTFKRKKKKNYESPELESRHHEVLWKQNPLVDTNV